MNTQLHLGDCLKVVGNIPDESCHVVYLDPPFFTQKRHSLVTRARDKEFSFDDVWSSPAEYRQFLHERVEQFHRVLATTGSIFFHCDRTASHVARTVLDAIFTEEMFRAEIIWFYRRWSNAQKGLLPQHQTILWYSKSSTYTFHPAYEPYSHSTNVDQLLQRRVRDEHGKAVYARDDEGNTVPSKPKQGVPMGDVWDIPYLNPKASERVGYPTQKPVLLLERIIQLSTSPGDVVLDPFCGSGTTLVAASLLQRRSIGVDVSSDAVSLTKARLANPQKTESRLVTEGRDSYEQVDARALVILRGLGAIPVQRNKGIDALIPCESEGRNALIRIQRDEESLRSAVERLIRASVGKNASHLIVIATQPVPHGFVTPAGCIVVSTPSATIKGLLRASSTNGSVVSPSRADKRPVKSQHAQLPLRVY